MNIMSKELSQSQIDQLRQHLIVPLAVGDILHHDLAVEPDMQYGLHLALSEIDPDSALLAIALCAKNIAEKTLNRAPIAQGLYKEASFIIEEYGATWLHHYKSGPMSDNDFEMILHTIPEDLESMADLLDALCSDLDDDKSAPVLLANLMSIQARAHMEIADYMISELEFEKSVKQSEDSNQPLPERDNIDLKAHVGDNIILFPGTRG